MLKICRFVLFLLLFTACPGNDDCDDMDSITRVNDLITLLPEQEIYDQGDIITLKLTLPSVNDYFGNEIDLFQETNDNSVRLVLAFNQLFTDNQLMFIEGSDGGSDSNNWYNLIYNESLDVYELEIEITLNRTGAYSFVTDDYAVFNGGGCNRYRLDTNVLWTGDTVVEFTVN